ncbi:MAG: hypothetical protein GXP28_06885 [Planctomycetes bacterium]|nr:hypothetical protein [Planctomycetota bacterium]
MDQQTYLTPDIAPRLAAIDIGSNSIRLVVAEAQPDGRYRILDDERESTRLGRSLATTGTLDKDSIAASLDALRRFQSIVSGLGVENYRAIATCAVREATNGEAFCRQVKEQLGLSIEVISSQKEAHLAFHTVGVLTSKERTRCSPTSAAGAPKSSLPRASSSRPSMRLRWAQFD